MYENCNFYTRLLKLRTRDCGAIEWGLPIESRAASIKMLKLILRNHDTHTITYSYIEVVGRLPTRCFEV